MLTMGALSQQRQTDVELWQEKPHYTGADPDFWEGGFVGQDFWLVQGSNWYTKQGRV